MYYDEDQRSIIVYYDEDQRLIFVYYDEDQRSIIMYYNEDDVKSKIKYWKYFFRQGASFDNPGEKLSFTKEKII